MTSLVISGWYLWSVVGDQDPGGIMGPMVVPVDAAGGYGDGLIDTGADQVASSTSPPTACFSRSFIAPRTQPRQF